MDQTRARQLLTGARVARLATVGEGGVPHLVPVTFAVDGDEMVIAIDHKPKTTTNLRRLRNIRENSAVCALADFYSDDWTRLWWARADGQAVVVEEGEARQVALDLLARKYGQYREHVPEGPVIVITVDRWSGWAYSE